MTLYVILGGTYRGRTFYEQMYGGYFDEKKAQTRLRQLAEMHKAVEFRIEELEVVE